MFSASATSWIFYILSLRYPLDHLQVKLDKMASIPPTNSMFTDDPWETTIVIREGHEDKRLLQRHISLTLGRTDERKDRRTMESRLRTDQVLRRRIIIGACVGSFLFLALLGFGVSMLAA